MVSRVFYAALELADGIFTDSLRSEHASLTVF
jgi:hypothetical protein